jgi:Bacterial CdiA-CT RNAse A domain
MQLDALDGPRPDGPRMPVEELAVYEAHGGHTLRKHVGLSLDDNLHRIRTGHGASGCFADLATAQSSVEEAIHRHRDGILEWRWGPNRALPYSFVEDLRRVIGTSLRRDDVVNGLTQPSPVTAIRLVLRPSDELAAGFTLVTAYPTRPRRTIPTRATGRRSHAGARA